MSIKDMKQDEMGMAIENLGASTAGFAKSHKALVTGVLVGIAVVAISVGGFRWWSKSTNAAAQTAFAAAATLADGIDNPAASRPGQAPEKTATWAEVAAAFQSVASKHPGTTAGEFAAYEAGIAQLRAGDAAAAVATLTAFSDKNPKSWAAPHALAALATALEQQADLAGAEAALVKLKDGEFPSHAPGVALARLAEFYERHDRADDAAKLWTLLAEDARFADTSAQSQAKTKLAPPAPQG